MSDSDNGVILGRMSSTRRADLVATAARLLAEEGPKALSARRLAAAMGTSTMAVYTYFGSMPEVVREVIREGFGRLAFRLADVPATADPVADLAESARAYRASALADPHVYAVMFGGSSIAGFALSEEDRKLGLYTLRITRDGARRCIEAGRFRPADPWLLAHQQWCMLHGFVQLELAGFLAGSYPTETAFDTQLRDFAVGAGDSLTAASTSVGLR